MPQNTPTIQEFLTTSPESLQILTDFDGTLTKELKDGVPAQSIISVLQTAFQLHKFSLIYGTQLHNFTRIHGTQLHKFDLIYGVEYN